MVQSCQPRSYNVHSRFHSFAVHAEKGDWKSVGEEFLFDGDGVFNDGKDSLLAGLVLEMLEHEAGEIAMKAFVARDQLVAER